MKAVAIKAEWASLNLADDDSVVVCAKRNGTTDCVRFDSLNQLKQAIGHRKVSVKKWAVTVPQSSCILKPLALPASNLNEAFKMIEFELPSLVPLPVDEIVYGCSLLDDQGSMLNVLVCIVKLSVLSDYLEPYRAIGIKPNMIVCDSLAIQSWFNTRGAAGSKVVISVLLNELSCVIQACADGNFHKARELTFSGEAIAESSREILEEISRQARELPAPQEGATEVLLAGSREHVSAVDDALRSFQDGSAALRKVTVVPTPTVVHCNDEGKYEGAGDKYGCDAVVAAGLLEIATSSSLRHSNLLPREVARQHKRKALLLKYLSTASVFLVLIMSVWLYLVTVNWRIGRLSLVIESQIAPIEHISSGVESKRRRVRAVQRQLSGRGQITQIIGELYKYTPEGISISELMFRSKPAGASIDIKGQADSLSTAFDYTQAVTKAKSLHRMQIVNAQQIARPDGASIVEFKAYCTIQDD